MLDVLAIIKLFSVYKDIERWISILEAVAAQCKLSDFKVVMTLRTFLSTMKEQSQEECPKNVFGPKTCLSIENSVAL